MFNFNVFDDLPLKYFSSNREINPKTQTIGRLENLEVVNNQYGKIQFYGPVDLTSLNIKDAIKIKSNQVIFSESFIQKNWDYFKKGDLIVVTLYKTENLSNQPRETLAQFITYNKGELIKFDVEGLVFNLYEIRSIDFNNFEFEREISEVGSVNSLVEKRFGAKSKRSFDHDASQSKRFKFRDEEYGKEAMFTKEASFNYDKFEQKSEMELDEEQDLRPPEKVKQNVKLFDPEKLVNVFDLSIFDKQGLRKNSKLLYNNFSCRVAFNQHGNFLSLGRLNKETYQFRVNVNKITPNSSLLKPLDPNDRKETRDVISNINSSFKIDKTNQSSREITKKPEEDNANNFMRKFNFSSIYYSNTFTKLLDIINTKNCKISNLGTPEFSYILREYIIGLENFSNATKEEISHSKYGKSLTKAAQDNFDQSLKQKINSDIKTLKLFEILFLNPFIRKDKTLNVVQVNSLDEKFKKMRKKKLIEWLIGYSKESYLNDLKENYKNKEKFNEVTKDQNEILIHLVSGRLLEAMRKCNLMNYSILSGIISGITDQSNKEYVRNSIKHLYEENLNKKISKPMLKILNLLKGENIENNLNVFDWQRVLISHYIYLSGSDTEMNEIFVNTENFIMNNYKNFTNLFPLPKTNYGKGCQILLERNKNDFDAHRIVQSLSSFDYNLIKFYSTFEYECLNFLTRTSTHSDDLIDHHIQYIIITILLNTLSENYKSNVDSFIILKLKLHQQKLFHIVLEEMLCYGNWDLAVRLINTHSLPDNIRNGLYKSIVGRELYNFEKESELGNFKSKLKILVDKYNIDIFNQIIETIGFYFEYKNMYKEALDNYFESGSYQKAHEVLCNKLLPMSIINRNINNNLKQKLNTLSKNSVNINNWVNVGNIFLLYFKYNEANYNKGSKERIQIEQLEDLLKKISALPEKDPIMISCKNVMLLDIREKVNKCLENDSNEEFYNVVIPNMNWIANKNISSKLKNLEFNDSLTSLIKLKSRALSEKIKI